MRVPDLISNDDAISQRTRQHHTSSTVIASSAASSSQSASPEVESLPPPTSRRAGPPSKKRRTAQTATHLTRRKRAATACQFCRLRKTKCDNVHPVCGFCRHHHATCVYGDEEEDEEEREKLVNAAQAQDEGIASLAILERLDEIKHLLQRTRSPSKDQPALVEAEGPQAGTHQTDRTDIHQHGNNSEPYGYFIEDHDQHREESSRTLYSALRCESMLRWPVFEGIVPEDDARIESFILEFGTDMTDDGLIQSSNSLTLNGSGIQEDAFVPLCRKFLTHVHPRNPILEGNELLAHAKQATEYGIKWDSPSCIVLLACALASLTTPWIPPQETAFMTQIDVSETPFPPILEPQDCGTAEAYYLAASKRIGLLGASILDIQCLFLASMYEKCRLRPLRACFYIQQASTRLQAHLLRRGRRPWRGASGREEPTQPLEQRLFWSCFKAENEILTTLGLRQSGLEDFTYPDSFPAPPSTLSTATVCTISVNETPAHPSDYAWSPLSDSQQRLEEERSWLYYLAEISLRRTIKNTMSVLYRKGEAYWLRNEDLLIRQYDEFEKEISQLHSHLPPLIQFTEHDYPDNELAFYLQGRFQGWRESTLRPLLYCALQGTQARGQHDQSQHHPTNPRVIHLAHKAVDTCAAMIVKTAHHHRHGGSWFVARRAFSCAVMVLAVVAAGNRLVEPPSNWSSLVRLALRVLGRWGREARDLERMRETLQRLFHRVQQKVGSGVAV
ncbi:uncharacterized protein BDZ83DRAFT_579008 [Colletotrichum acutatum]|uniref:Zn(2)-C6 fungal-type domain-containing protein n=1 Tax=Glomerella acutata TaxID=27357 RepID=A0AAD8UH90_GLOAC|nr:uncharacterized protein BDZ83DRAFT_579008 [Colletotrichum acutatum]KAK1724247.1 hypothetical protein BDZ83DRAFT_579008 [Colletotrichum acutatum]